MEISKIAHPLQKRYDYLNNKLLTLEMISDEFRGEEDSYRYIFSKELSDTKSKLAATENDIQNNTQRISLGLRDSYNISPLPNDEVAGLLRIFNEFNVPYLYSKNTPGSSGFRIENLLNVKSFSKSKVKKFNSSCLEDQVKEARESNIALTSLNRKKELNPFSSSLKENVYWIHELSDGTITIHDVYATERSFGEYLTVGFFVVGASIVYLHLANIVYPLLLASFVKERGSVMFCKDSRDIKSRVHNHTKEEIRHITIHELEEDKTLSDILSSYCCRQKDAIAEVKKIYLDRVDQQHIVINLPGDKLSGALCNEFSKQ